MREYVDLRCLSVKTGKKEWAELLLYSALCRNTFVSEVD